MQNKKPSVGGGGELWPFFWNIGQDNAGGGYITDPYAIL